MKKKVWHCLYGSVTVLLVICALSILYQRVMKSEEDVSLFGFRSYIVLSGSMEPALQVGDLIISRQVDEDRIAVGDIITFRDEDGFTITHRVVDIFIKDGKTLFQTRGDQNNVNDTGLLSIENIKGKYLFKIDGFGNVVARIQPPAGPLTFLPIAIAGYFAVSKAGGGKPGET